MKTLKGGLLLGGLFTISAFGSIPAVAQASTVAGVVPEYNDLASQQLFSLSYPTLDPDNIAVPAVAISNVTCSQQLDKVSWGLDAGATGAELLGLGAEIATAIDPSGISEAVAVLVQTGAFFTHTVALGIQAYPIFADLPDCNTDIVGGVRVTQGGIDVSGDSVIRGSLGVGGTLSVSGDFLVSEINSRGLISAWDGDIVLGTVDGTAPDAGISIGGGAIAGAGHLGAQSISRSPTSIAIGNLSQANYNGSLALGTNAISDAEASTALGYGARATGAGATALGAFASASGVASLALGNEAQSLGDNSVAIGNGATASNGAAVAIGLFNMASGDGAVAIGDPNFATGRGAVAIGADNTATGVAALAIGADNVATGDGAQALGLNASATGTSAIASGTDASAEGVGALAMGLASSASGTSAIASGTNASATGIGAVATGLAASATGNSALASGTNATAAGEGALATGLAANSTGISAIASGTNATADGTGAVATGLGANASGTAALASGTGATAVGEGAVAIGVNANATGDSAIAIGPDASAGFAGSVAIGPGATTSRNGQLALGSSAATVTMPGLTSAASLAAQTGSLGLVTTDAGGNLATDGGHAISSLLSNRQGVALGIAMANPDLAGDERGGIAFNRGEFDGASAYSISGSTVIASNIFGLDRPGRIVLSGSLGIASSVRDDVYRIRRNESVATRVGGQITW